MEMIRWSKPWSDVLYMRSFAWRNDPETGFSFQCALNGSVILLTDDARQNYRKCVDGIYDVIDCGILAITQSWIEPAIGRCICGTDVVLKNPSNTCRKCGRNYDMGGFLLGIQERIKEDGKTSADDLGVDT